MYHPVSESDVDNVEDEDNAIELTGLGTSDDDDDNSLGENNGEEEDFQDEDVIDDDDAEDNLQLRDSGGGHTRLPLEFLEEQLLWNVWNSWVEPCLLSILITTFVLLPTMILWIYGAFAFVGRFWSVWIFVMHLQLRFAVSTWYITSMSKVGFTRRRSLRVICSAMTVLEIILLITYCLIGNVLTEAFFRDVDGTIVVEWKKEFRFVKIASTMSILVIILRCAVGLPCTIIRAMKYTYPDSYREWRPTFWTPYGDEDSLGDATRYRLFWSFRLATLLIFVLNIICILSAMSHLGPWPLYSLPEDCDPLDDTECALPFPSFHHMIKDDDSATGWRVHLRGLPPLRGGIPFHPNFLNELDGFSTSKLFLCSFTLPL